jgi:hypothetical protein
MSSASSSGSAAARAARSIPDASPAVKALVSGFGSIRVIGCNGLWPFDQFCLRCAPVDEVGEEFRTFMDSNRISLESQQEIAWADLIAVNPSFVVFLKPTQTIGRRCPVPIGCGRIELGVSWGSRVANSLAE